MNRSLRLALLLASLLAALALVPACAVSQETVDLASIPERPDNDRVRSASSVSETTNSRSEMGETYAQIDEWLVSPTLTNVAQRSSAVATSRCIGTGVRCPRARRRSHFAVREEHSHPRSW